MKNTLKIIIAAVALLSLYSCKENYSNGEKVGNLIEFTTKGVIWDSWEGRMNMTQTFDNDRTDQGELIELMKQAQVEGWKLKLRYHEVWGLKNLFCNRGDTDYFIDEVTVLDRNFAKPLNNLGSGREGKVGDTIWVVVDKAELLRNKK